MPASPSLLIVPARFKTGKLYTQIATTSAGLVLASSGDFNVTRNTTATRFNSAGLIESVASGVPRLDYYTSGGTAGCPALLVEPSAQNVARFVNQMTGQDLPAASGGLTITTGSTDFLAPDGASGSITKYVGGAASGANQQAYYVGGNITASASGVHTFSLFVKAGATNPLNFCAIGFALYTGASGTFTSYFSLASGTALTSGANIQDYGNGWYRLTSAPYTIAAWDLAGQLTFNFASSSGSLSFAASGALNLTAYTWGAQMEAGSVATSYIPTTTGSVTRNADDINLSGAVSGCIGQTEGTLYAEVDYRNLPNAAILTIQSSSFVSGAVRLETAASNGSLRVQILDASGATALDQTITSPQLTIGINKIALGYSSNASGVVTALNGSIINTSTASFGTLGATRVCLGSRSITAGSFFFNNRIRSAALYTTRLTNAELIALSTL
jgi:hypothetical protein